MTGAERVVAVVAPRVHDVEKLTALLPGTVDVKLSVEEQRRLTDYATVTRYPGDYEKIDLREARQAVNMARRVRREIRRFLPGKAL